MTNLPISAELMQPIVAKAILDSLDGQQRDMLITAALQYLITPPPAESLGYGRARQEPSPLQNAFNMAVQHAALDVVKEILSEPENDAQLRAAISDGVMKALADRYTFADSVSTAVADYIRNKFAD